jgi:hypothetical protein
MIWFRLAALGMILLGLLEITIITNCDDRYAFIRWWRKLFIFPRILKNY